MSVPRLRRTVACAPSATSRSRNAATRAGGDPVVGQPGVGLSGIRLTWAAGRRRRHSAASSHGVAVAIVDPVDHRPLEADPTTVGGEVLGARLEHGVDRIAAVQRHERVAQRVVGGVQADGERHRQRVGGELADARHDTDGRDRDVAGRQAEAGVDPFDGGPHRSLVGERFAHAHEHDVAQSPSGPLGPRRRQHDLLDDLAGRQVAVEPGLTGGAEPAAPSRTRPGSTRTPSPARGRASARSRSRSRRRCRTGT